MASESPFYLSKVECPVCKTVNEFETVKVGAYYENGRDTDFCPLDIQWRYPRYQGYNPLVFFAATCSNCYYSREFTNSFKDWKNDANYKTYRLKTVKEKHLERLATADSVIKAMGHAIDITRHPNESAVLKLHLAVLDEMLCDHYSNLDLGRFYLRIGWVYRALEEGENPSMQFLRGMMIEVDNKFSVFREATNSCREEFDTFARHLSSHFETNQVAAEIKSQMYVFRDRFDAETASLKEQLEQTQNRVGDFGRMIDEYKSVTLGGGSAGDGSAFGQYHSFGEFLLFLKKGWDGIVTNEHEALEKAVHHYKEAFASGREISAGNQQIQVSYLIAELSRRIGDHDGAREYFNSTIKHGQEFIYRNRNDKSRTALARKILELAIEQGKANLQALKSA